MRRDQGLVIDMTMFHNDPTDRSNGGGSSRRGGSQSKRDGRQQMNMVEDSSSSNNLSQNFSNFSFGESSQSSHSYYPPYYQQISYPSYYQQPSFMAHDCYPPIQAPQYYQEPHHQQIDQTRSGLFDSIFGQGNRHTDSESESYDPPRHSTIW